MFPIPGHAADRLRYLNATLSSVHHLFRQHRVPVDTERLSGEHCRLQPLAYRRAAHSTASSPIIGQFNGTADAQLGAKDGHARPRAVRGDPSSPACWPLSVHLGAHDCHSIGPRGWSMTEELRLCSSAKMQAIRDLIAKVAALDITVLLQGESGVGKEVVARAIHLASPRVHRQFLKVNCAALPGELLESELFGHEKGAFTDACRQKPGKFEAVDQGTLLLDEIGEIPLRLQATLLHVLQDGECSL